MKQNLHRLEVMVPESKNPYVEITNFPGHDDNHKDWKAFVRIAGGRSFLSGFDDMVLFDGIMSLELKLTVANFKIKLKPEMVQGFISKLSELLPDKFIQWNDQDQVVELSLLESCSVPVDKSSVVVIQKVAEEFGIAPDKIQSQNAWQLVKY